MGGVCWESCYGKGFETGTFGVSGRFGERHGNEVIFESIVYGNVGTS